MQLPLGVWAGFVRKSSAIWPAALLHKERGGDVEGVAANRFPRFAKGRGALRRSHTFRSGGQFQGAAIGHHIEVHKTIFHKKVTHKTEFLHKLVTA